MIAILRKDLATHFWVLGPACALALVLLAFLTTESMLRGGSVLGAFGLFVTVGLGPLAWLLVNRLVVHEYTSGGERALQHLPLGPLRVLAPKIALGAICLVALLALSLSVLLAGAEALRRGIPEAQAAFLFERSLGFLAVLYSALLAGASLGRHRFVAAALVACALVSAGQIGVDLRAWTPIGVLDEAYAVSRVEGVSNTALLAGVLLVVAGVFTHARGSRSWRGPASKREGIGCATVFLVFAVGHPGTDSRGTGFELDGDVLRWDRPGVSLVVRQLDGDATGRLADAAGGDLLALSDALGVDAPRVHVDRGLGVFERASLPWTGPSVTDAVLVRAGFDSPHFQLRTFRVWLLGQVFEPMTRGRLRRGGWRVIQDGYPGWSVARSVENSPAQSRQEELRVAWGLQALAASGISDDALLARWPDVRRRVGDVVAQSLAQHVLSLVGKEQGDAAVRALARGALDERRAFFGSFRANEDSLESLFVQHAGASRADVSRRLAALRDPLLAKHAEALATLAPLDSLVVAPGPEDPNGLRALRFSTGAGPGRFAFLHAGARLSLRALEVPTVYEREEVPLGAEPAATGSRYSPGTRVLFSFARYVPLLGCDVLSGWREVQLP